jgi:hypothetical protein
LEKLIYVAWRGASTPAAFRSALLERCGPRLVELGAHAVSMNISDADSAFADHLRITQVDDFPVATVSLWLDTHLARAAFEAELARHCPRLAGYLVVESVPIVNRKHPTDGGKRIPGLCTIAFLEKPASMDYEAWRERWQGHHTQVAIETQSTFLYIQNVVVRPLTAAAPPWTAIVEECFPREAATDPMVFYDAEGSDEKLRANQRRMFESCQAFIDFPTLESHPMSSYVVKGLAADKPS